MGSEEATEPLQDAWQGEAGKQELEAERSVTVESQSLLECPERCQSVEREDEEANAPACKRQRISEQGEAIDVACRLSDSIAERQADEGNAASEVTLAQEVPMPGRLVAPVKRLFSWLQSSWASRSGRYRQAPGDTEDARAPKGKGEIATEPNRHQS